MCVALFHGLGPWGEGKGEKEVKGAPGFISFCLSAVCATWPAATCSGCQALFVQALSWSKPFFPSGVSHQAFCHSNKESHYCNSCTIGKQIQGPAFSFSFLRRQLPTKKINSPLSWSLWQQSDAPRRWNQFNKHLRRSHFMLPDIFGRGPLPHCKPQDAEWIGSQTYTPCLRA